MKISSRRRKSPSSLIVIIAVLLDGVVLVPHQLGQQLDAVAVLERPDRTEAAHEEDHVLVVAIHRLDDPLARVAGQRALVAEVDHGARADVVVAVARQLEEAIHHVAVLHLAQLFHRPDLLRDLLVALETPARGTLP